MNMTVGLKYYRYLDDSTLEVVRLERIKNQDTFIVRDQKGDKFKLNKAMLLKYTKLNPDGYMAFSIVALEHEMEDVIVSLHRRKDIEANDTMPFCICRQNIFDMFTNQIERNDNITHIGCSVTKDSCPIDVKYEILLACNNIIQTTIVNIYIDDIMEDILSFVNLQNYDYVLQKLSSRLANENIVGCCNSVKELLSTNTFRNDFMTAFGIIYLPMRLGSAHLSKEQRNAVEDIIKCVVLEYVILPYDKDINLDKMEQTHILISDIDFKLYVLAYNKGSYINRNYEALDDKQDREALLGNKKV